MALGATAAHVRAVTRRAGLAPVVVGTVIGCVAAVLTTPSLDALLFDVPARDPWSAVAGVTFVALAAALATLPPARRASRIDPASMLRAD